MITGLERIEQLVGKYPNRKIQTLMHLVNVNTVKEIHMEQVRDKAVGIDKVSKDKYETDLQANAEKLIMQMRKFSYRPKPVRRVYIEKVGSSGLRPLGIPAYEDRFREYLLKY
ncbi:MAG: hypothetical protein Ta2E_13000 [Mycoplasmoidaceae bacterium]|nr:MAG: hypothetical protein Ta2E_13000 [Mycoplasmoidaceae bacterium]